MTRPQRDRGRNSTVAIFWRRAYDRGRQRTATVFVRAGGLLDCGVRLALAELSQSQAYHNGWRSGCYGVAELISAQPAEPIHAA
jgi:hypothetical protein